MKRYFQLFIKSIYISKYFYINIYFIMVTFNIPEFQKTIWAELNAVKDRVRNLIWSTHRWEDWRYKEKILQKVIRQYLPKDFNIGWGFIIKKIDEEILISSQQDIIVYDNSYPVVFSEWDFVITTPNSVKAIVEVKSRIWDCTKLNGILSDFSWMNNFQEFMDNNNIFKWLFSYESPLNFNRINSHVNKENLKYLNHICLNNDLFMKYRNEDEWQFFSFYEINWYSFSYFLSNLLHTICDRNKVSELHPFSFSYPSEYWKESRLTWKIMFG